MGSNYQHEHGGAPFLILNEAKPTLFPDTTREPSRANIHCTVVNENKEQARREDSVRSQTPYHSNFHLSLHSAVTSNARIVSLNDITSSSLACVLNVRPGPPVKQHDRNGTLPDNRCATPCTWNETLSHMEGVP